MFSVYKKMTPLFNIYFAEKPPNLAFDIDERRKMC